MTRARSGSAQGAFLGLCVGMLLLPPGNPAAAGLRRTRRLRHVLAERVAAVEAGPVIEEVGVGHIAGDQPARSRPSRRACR